MLVSKKELIHVVWTIGVGDPVPKSSKVHTEHQTNIQEFSGNSRILRKQTTAGKW